MSALKVPLPPADPADSPPALPIEVRPYAPGLLCMTIPAALVLSAGQAGRLVVQIHDALEQLRRLDEQAAAAEKNGRAAGRGIARKRKRR